VKSPRKRLEANRVGNRCSPERTLDPEEALTAQANGEGRNRTGDTTVFSRVLYRLSYLAARGSV
jgi:hypothetical protein